MNELRRNKVKRASDLIRFKGDEDDALPQDDSVNIIPCSYGEKEPMAEPVENTLAVLEKAERDFETAIDTFSNSMEQLFDVLEKVIVSNSEQSSEQDKDGR